MKKLYILLIILLLPIGYAKAQYLKKGFWGGVEMVYGLSLSDKGDAFKQTYGSDARMQTFDIRTVFGYYLTKNFSLGTGIGLATHSEPRVNLVPIFLDFRYHPFSKVNENFYINANIGTSLANNQSKMDPKFLWEVSMGYMLFDLGNFTLSPAIGYSFFQYNIEKWSDAHQTFLEDTQKRHTLFFRLSLTY